MNFTPERGCICLKACGFDCLPDRHLYSPSPVSVYPVPPWRHCGELDSIAFLHNILVGALLWQVEKQNRSERIGSINLTEHLKRPAGRRLGFASNGASIDRPWVAPHPYVVYTTFGDNVLQIVFSLDFFGKINVCTVVPQIMLSDMHHSDIASLFCGRSNQTFSLQVMARCFSPMVELTTLR